MRLLLLTGEYPPLKGGIADYTRTLAEHLAAQGTEVAVLTSIGALQEAGPVRVFPTIRDWGLSVLPTLRTLARHYDLIHIQYQAANFQLKGAIPLLPALLRQFGGPPVVTTFHDLRQPYLFPKAGPLRTLALKQLACASAAIITTNVEDEAILTQWGAHPIHRIPLGNNIPHDLPPDFDRDAWRARWGVAPNHFLVAHFGFINTSKGIPTLIRAQDRLLRAAQPVKLMFLGERLGTSDPTNAAHLAEIESLTEEFNLEEWQIWTDHLPPTEIAAGLAAADIVALPYSDGASLRRTTLITALAHGRPVVTTTPRLPIDLLKDNETVALAKPDEPGDLARRLALLLRYEPSRARLARAAATLAPHFAWDDIATRHRHLYRTLRSP
jgi:glycosyltransferase involved in cell wall biosynthesis